MESQFAKKTVQELLSTAGIAFGRQPGDIHVHNDAFYTRALQEGELGVGESYMDGWWDCEKIDDVVEKIMSANLQEKVKKSKKLLLMTILNKIFNFQTKKKALIVGERHYDLGIQLFESTLDSRMNYTCGYWKQAKNLEEAQLAKLELTCQKLLLKPGMRLLDIGCGFGALAQYAAEQYGVTVVGITISKDQHQYAAERCRGLPVEIRFQDYRDLNEQFDRIVSLGMFEHVGYLNYRTYMTIAHRCLNDQGIFLLHTIGNNKPELANPWITKYIFPNGILPSISQIGKAIEGLFVMEDWHNFGVDYDKTLLAWRENFERHWEQLKAQYDERFRRMWNYYLLSCAGGFRARSMQLWQVVLSKGGLHGGYCAPR